MGATLLCSGCDDPDANGGDGMGTGDGETGGTDAADVDAGDGDGDPADTGEPIECDGTSPYMGGWDIGCCQDDIVPNGWSIGGIKVGTIMPDWTLTDQFGDAVRLWDFCHDAIWFEYVALW